MILEMSNVHFHNTRMNEVEDNLSEEFKCFNWKHTDVISWSRLNYLHYLN